MLGSISATDGHACMLRAMCEVSKLLSSHTGAILRKKSSLIVWQFHIKLEQFWPKLTVFHDDACLQASAAPFHSDGLLGDALNLLLSASHALVGEETEEEVGSYRDYTDAQAEGMVRRISNIIIACISLYHVVPYIWDIYIQQNYTWPVTTVCSYKIQVSGDCSSYGRLCPISFFDFLSNGINSLWVLNQTKEAFSNSI